MATGATVSGHMGGSAEAGRRIVLAHQPAFVLGPLTVEPASRRLSREGGQEAILEPRVMQVLVALAQRPGVLLSRQDLFDCCWDGRIVGEDALNRVLSRLRRVSETIGEGVFRVETVTRVGFRLALDPGVSRSAAAVVGAHADAGRAPLQGGRSPSTTRRTMLRAAAAVAAAAVPVVWAMRDQIPWPSVGVHAPNPEAKRLYDEGMKAQYQAYDATSEQAEAYFRQATEADPNWADAWGSLAMSYRHMMDGETNVSQWRLAEQTRSAARRALTLDPDNAEALVALALIPSPYRRWSEAEARYRPLSERFPQAFVLQGHYGRLLRDLGRFEEAVALTRTTYELHPFIPFTALGYFGSLWGAGRIHEAGALIEEAYKRWPKHFAVWFTRTEFLTYTGRTGAAIGFVSDREGRPAGAPDYLFDRRSLVARAIETRAPTDIDAATKAVETYIARSLAGPQQAVGTHLPLPFFVAIGDLDRAFALIEGYYFDRGRYARPQEGRFGPLTRRDTSQLFMPYTAALRRDRRFGPLLDAIGLEAHWRTTGQVPDFRSKKVRSV